MIGSREEECKDVHAVSFSNSADSAYDSFGHIGVSDVAPRRKDSPPTI
jgi:hypothetical protein